MAVLRQIKSVSCIEGIRPVLGAKRRGHAERPGRSPDKSKFLSICLAGLELAPYIILMRTRGRGLLHTAMAVVFGFMSLMHGPVMTFAKAGPASAHVSHHGADHHHAAPAEDPSPATPASAPVCYAFGCFIALDVAPLVAPAAVLNPIGALSPAAVTALHAGDIEPAVPPPRLHV